MKFADVERYFNAFKLPRKAESQCQSERNGTGYRLKG
jgi:hypothetical protein